MVFVRFEPQEGQPAEQEDQDHDEKPDAKMAEGDAGEAPFTPKPRGPGALSGRVDPQFVDAEALHEQTW
jgi:hypothetical protein